MATDINARMKQQVQNQFPKETIRTNYVMQQPDINVEGYLSEKLTEKQASDIAKMKAADAASSTAGVVSAKNLPTVAKGPYISTTDALDGEMSMPTGDGMPIRQEKTNEQLYTDYRKQQAVLAGVQFAADYLNATAAYNTVKGQAQLNILQARNQGADAIYRGRQAQMNRQSEGYQQGQDAILAMAAQGQDVQGAGVQKIQASLEAMGIYNGMQEEINSMKEALGFRLEEVNYKYQVDQAKNQKDAAILGSAINLGANLAGVI